MRKIICMFVFMFLLLPIANAGIDFNRAEDTDMSRFKTLTMSEDRVVFFDIKTVKYKKNAQGKNMYNIIDVWQRTYYVSDDTRVDIESDLNNAGKVLGRRDLLEFEIYHCYYNVKEKTYSPIQRIIYDDKGKIILNETYAENFQEIVPGTGGELWLAGIAKYVEENHSTIKRRY